MLQINLLLVRRIFECIIIFGSPIYAISQGFSPEDQMKLRKSSGLFGEQGYSNTIHMQVDGKLSTSSSNGNVMYTYPISSRTIKGFSMDCSLNYCGSVGFTAFASYGINQTAENLFWNSLSTNRPAWILSFNNFAIQVIGFNNMLCVNPYFYVGPDTSQTEYDRHINWCIDGYDFCNRMFDFVRTSDGNGDVIKLLRGDGSVLELFNPYVRGDFSSNDVDAEPRYFTGFYYERGVNTHGYAKVEYDDAYFQDFYKNILNSRELNDKHSAYRPRIVRYYPGDGLEYLFREWVTPFGSYMFSPITSGNSAHYFGGVSASATIFYLEEVRNGNSILTKFLRSRHFPKFTVNGSHEDSTKGRAPVFQFDGHSLDYGINTLTIQALGRTIKVQYDSVIKEGVSANDLELGIPWGVYGSREQADNLATEPMTSISNQYKSYYGYITRITDPENRVTTFDYEVFNRHYIDFKFPNSMKKIAHNIVPILRLTNISEPSQTEYDIEYYHDIINGYNIDYNGMGGNGIYSPGGISYKMNNVAHYVYKRRASDKSLLSTSEYRFNINNSIEPGPNFSPDFSLASEIINTDKVDNTHTSILTEFKRIEVESPRVTNINFYNPVTYVYSPSIVQTTTDESIITRTEEKDSVAGNSKYVYAPIWKSVQYLKSGGDTVLKSYQTYRYDYDQVRTYGDNTTLANKIGWEKTADTTFIYRPDSINAQPLLYIANRYRHFSSTVDTLTYIDSIWQKNASIQEYLRLKAEGDPDVVGKRWEDVMCLGKIAIFKYDTLENSPIDFAPIYNLPTFSGVFDKFGNYLSGKSYSYYEHASLSGKPTFARGKICSDSIISRGGNARFCSGTYSYDGNFYASGLIRDITNALGALTYKGYDYNLPWLAFVPQGKTCSEFKLPIGYLCLNNDSKDSIELSGGYLSFSAEKPLVEQIPIRKYKLDSITGEPKLSAEALTTFYERTYYGLVSAMIDPNGWYSKFNYDKNGRIIRTWIPFDFYRPGSIYASPLRIGELDMGTIGIVDRYIRHY